MIRREELIEIGRFLKTHGIAGEVNFAPLYDIDLTELRCIVVEMDGIPVPFFVEKVRPKGADSLIVKIDGIDSDKGASELTNKPVYALIEDVDIDSEEEDDGISSLRLIGYTMIDGESGKRIGVIDHIDDTTQNWLFMVKPEEGERFVAVPVADEFVAGLDPEKRVITVALPTGLLEL